MSFKDGYDADEFLALLQSSGMDEGRSGVPVALLQSFGGRLKMG